MPALGCFCQGSCHPCSPSCSSNRLTLLGLSAPLVFPPLLLQQTQIFRAGKAYACSLSVMPQAPPGALPASPGMDQLGESNMCHNTTTPLLCFANARYMVLGGTSHAAACLSNPPGFEWLGHHSMKPAHACPVCAIHNSRGRLAQPATRSL